MRYLAGLTLLIAAPASADVVGASAHGFELSFTINLTVTPEVAFSAFANMPAWWNADHTYSGDARNLSLALTPGGCFCERFPKGGGIEHMRATYLDPGKRIVMTGSLGPLLYDATSAVMDVEVKSQAGGSQLTLNYRAAGFARGNGAASAPMVDKVLADQLRRYRAFAVSRPRT